MPALHSNSGTRGRVVKSSEKNGLPGSRQKGRILSDDKQLEHPGGKCLHPDEPPMATVPQPLIEFTRACLERGISRGDVAAALEAAGWSARESAAAVDAFAESALPVPVPRKRVSSGPREAFIHFLAMVLLYLAAIASGTVLFLLIDRLFPDPARGAYVIDFSRYLARFSAAVLIVTTPLLVLVRWAITREQARNPASRIAGVVRVLAYLTLLGTSLVMVGDLISVLVGFLNGDLTTPFLFKSGVVLLLAGGVYLWYSSGLVRDERLAERPSIEPAEPAWRPRLAAAGLALAIGCLITGLVLSGSPLERRLVRLDQQRIADLRQIEAAIERFHDREKKLPESLAELEQSPQTSVGKTADPVSGGAYRYRVVDEQTYLLGATFDLATPDTEPDNWQNSQGFFRHPAGEHEFRITVK